MVSVWDLGLSNLTLLKNANMINIAEFMSMELADEFLCSIISILHYTSLDCGTLLADETSVITPRLASN